jgi:hypothetical protein
MSSSRPSLAQRIGIWEAHNHKCAYCDEPLPYRQLEIDHVIPDHLSNKPDELRELLSQLRLPEDFDLHDVSNLLPAHRHCNTKKTGMPFSVANTLFFLEYAARKKASAQAQEANYIKRSRSERVLAALQLALASGELSADEVMTILKGEEGGANTFEVMRAIHFSSRIIVGMLERSDVESLLDEPLLPRTNGLHELRMLNGTSDARSVITCREWASAVLDGYFAATTYDLKEEAFFKTAYAMIRALLVASVSQESFLDDSVVGINSLDLLPVSLLPTLSRECFEELTKLTSLGSSIADFVRKGLVKVESASPKHLEITYKGLGKAFWLVLKADLNGDSIEDMLVSTYMWATQGTLGVGDVIVLTRLGAEQPFRVLTDIELLPRQSPRP